MINKKSLFSSNIKKIQKPPLRSQCDLTCEQMNCQSYVNKAKLTNYTAYKCAASSPTQARVL